VNSWAASWQLTVSVEKCFVLNIGNVIIQPRISINGRLLPTVLSCRDLGITVSRDLSPSAHISGITVKAHQRANLIFRSFVSRDVSLLLRAYLTYVRPLVECNSVVWSPWPGWLVTYKDGLPVLKTVTHPSTNRARR